MKEEIKMKSRMKKLLVLATAATMIYTKNCNRRDGTGISHAGTLESRFRVGKELAGSALIYLT